MRSKAAAKGIGVEEEVERDDRVRLKAMWRKVSRVKLGYGGWVLGGLENRLGRRQRDESLDMLECGN